MQRLILLVSIGLVLLLVTVAYARQRTTQNKETDKIVWEYLVLAGGRSNLSSTGNSKMAKLSLDSSFREHFPLEMNLDKLGAEGWELVTVTLVRDEPVYYLKRAKDSTQ
jgi:hypothetical protein